ncbi:lipoprotein YdaJ [Lysinibacillus sp. NPDC096418]|uniref:lipoprotein YdaJ n=1 Tax=Lysinibacillus sp. NPDC096418 TaxID=3364138 RepID=UPI003817030D
MKLFSKWAIGFVTFIICMYILIGCQRDKYVLSIYQDLLPTQQFIQEHLLKNGWVQTDLTERADEYLSESIGLWMEFLVEQNDPIHFKKQVQMLEEHFLTKDRTVSWLILNDEKSTVNALIDDLRIMLALYNGAVLWEEQGYEKLADDMASALVKTNLVEGILVDYYDVATASQADFVTISYIIPEAYDMLFEKGFITKSQYTENKNIVANAPLSKDGFFPQRYVVTTKSYQYDAEINLIDQYYIGYHRAKWGYDVQSLVTLTKEAMASEGKIYGRINPKTKAPTVEYEAAAVYALATLMMLELEENELAQQLFQQLITMRISDSKSVYYGGYIVVDGLYTHMFDNILSLLAERRGKDAGIF